MTLTLFIAFGLAALGIALGWMIILRRASRPLAERIDAILPQTQCGKCGYAGCRPYAEAMALCEADINQCPPGGAQGIRLLARLLGRPVKPLSAAHGVEKPGTLALIDENLCIGCTLCIQACPVDAIIGTSRRMHTVLGALCTGCDLCLPPCPVDCIAMVLAPAARLPLLPLYRPGMTKSARAARARHAFRAQRLAREQAQRAARLAARAVKTAPDQSALIAAAMERARAQRQTAE